MQFGYLFMNKICSLLLVSFIAISIACITGCSMIHTGDKPIRILILSGKNNHEWQKTTPVLIRIFQDRDVFSTQVTNNPETLSFNALKKYDVIVSNWNFWPDSSLRMISRWESDFLRYVSEGGGVVFFHAGATSFYDWDAYHGVGIGRWGKETSHGIPTRAQVSLDQNHPVTRGMQDFYIMDEIWEKADIYPGATALGFLSARDENDGHPVKEPAVFVNQTGKGRTFYTILGHDERALLNSGLQALLQRAAQWCANREVTVKLPTELIKMESKKNDQFRWLETDTSIGLYNDYEIIWQFNFNNYFKKPYFHPLSVDHAVLTCVSPPDHPWHLGLWFSWKYINGVNYWEYMDDFRSPETGYKSEGITEIENIRIVKNPDLSADIGLNLMYYPAQGKTVLAEERSLHISSLYEDGSYYIDEQQEFTTLTDSVILDRTPILGEPDGQSFGGYAGLSMRFSQDFTSAGIISPTDTALCRKCDWLYMGYNTLTGKRAGIAIMQNPDFTPDSFAWYVIRDKKTPFWYFSPAVLYDHNMILKKGQILDLSYRIWILPGVVTQAQLQDKFDQFKAK